jgi:hypothetical protein
MRIVLAIRPGYILSAEPVEHPEHPREYRRLKPNSEPLHRYAEFWDGDEHLQVQTFSPFWRNKAGELREFTLKASDPLGEMPPGEYPVYFLEQ